MSFIKIVRSYLPFSTQQRTPLLLACEKGNFELVKLLLEKYHADLNAVDEVESFFLNNIHFIFKIIF